MKGRRRVIGRGRWCGWLTLLAAVLLLAACRSQATTWQRIQEERVLRIGLDPTFPPFESEAADGLAGLDVDLASALAADMGLSLQILQFGYDGLYDALDTGHVDVLISALVVAPERLKDFAYSEAYFDAGLILISQAQSPLEAMTELSGRRLGVELGAEGHVVGTEWTRRLTGLTVRTYESADAALTALAHGDVDAALVDSVSGRLFVRGSGALHIGKEPVTQEPYALAVRAKDERLLEELNASLQALRSSGQLEMIIAEWLG